MRPSIFLDPQIDEVPLVWGAATLSIVYSYIFPSTCLYLEICLDCCEYTYADIHMHIHIFVHACKVSTFADAFGISSS